MDAVNETTPPRTMRRLIAVAAIAGAAAVASLTIAATSGASTAPFITPGGIQSTGSSNGSPAAAASGFLENFVSGSPLACEYFEAPDPNPCAKLVATVRFAGRPSGMTFGLGNVATDGTKALVALITNYACFSTYLVPPGAPAGPRACLSNSDKNRGLPTSVSGFAAAYSASSGWPFGHSMAIPCEEFGGRWYVAIDGAGWYSMLQDGGAAVARTNAIPGSMTITSVPG